MKRKASGRKDRELSRKMAAKDLERQFREAPRGPMVRHGQLLNVPDGSDLTISFCIGTRGDLNHQEAKRAAKSWREHIKRYPKARFVIHLAGYDDDPRDIWEIDDAVRYVGWWARHAGMNDFDTAERLLGVPGFEHSSSLGFLAACGVFGEGAKQAALKDWSPTVAQ
jgi:hypothetical protein